MKSQAVLIKNKRHNAMYKKTSIGQPPNCVGVRLKNKIELIRSAVTCQQSLGT